MTTSVVYEQPEKKRAELENEWISLNQKIQAMREEMRKLEEQVTAKLEEKVKAKRAALEELELAKKALERKLEELEASQDPLPSSNEPIPIPEILEKKEPSSNMNMLCQSCGAENKTEAIFCERCGNRLHSE